MSVIAQCTATGEQHGLVNRIGNSVAFDDFKSIDPKFKAQVKKDKEEDAKIVKGRYMNLKNKSERLDKPYMKYAGDPICIYHLIHGYVYDLPMGFVKDVNSKKEIKRSGLVSVDGEAVNKNEAPLERDFVQDGHHQILPLTF